MKDSVLKMWLLAVKDVKVFISDWKALAFGLMFPLALIAFSLLAFGDAGGEDPTLHYYVVTREDEDGLSHQIIEELTGTDDIQVQQLEYSSAIRAVENEQIGAFMVFPEDFTDAVMAGYGTDIEVYTSPDAARSRKATRALAAEVALNTDAFRTSLDGKMAVLFGIEDADLQDAQIQEGMQDMFGDRSLAGPEILMEVEQVGAMKSPDAPNWAVSGYVVMFLFFTAALGAETIVRERENNTLQRLTASGAGRAIILGGKMMGAMVRAMVQASVLWGAGVWLFGMDLGGASASVFMVTLLFIFAAAGFSVFLASWAKSAESAGSVATLVSLVAAPLGGCWWPLFIAPQWLQNLSRLTPHGWANDALNRALLFAASPGDIAPSLFALFLFGAAFLFAAVQQFDVQA